MARERFQIERDAGGAAIVLVGEHDAYGAPELEERLEELLDDGSSIVVDLSRATFVDSVTLFLLLRARKNAAARGLGFSLQLGDTTGTHVHRMFEVTKLTDVFAIAPTRDGAVSAAQTPVPPD
jgi:anti-anti-sigma factor